MPLRSIDIVLPAGGVESLRGALRGDTVRAGPWQVALADGATWLRFLVDAEDSGRIVDAIEHRCAEMQGFHLTLQSVEAAIPRPPEPEEPEVPAEEPALPRLQRFIFGSGRKGLSREELYADAVDMSGLTRMYLATVVLSTVVAVVGLVKGSAAIIIGAMVIAPLLGPIMGCALAATLADVPLARRAAQSGLAGVGLALVLCALVGALAHPDMDQAEIVSRTHVDVLDIALALAAGSAGTLALTTGVSMGLVGVMVAVALLPPTAVLGMALGTGESAAAAGAALLLATNVLGILLAAIATFRVQGARPQTWWEAERAKRASWWAMATLVLMLCALGALVALS